jgi:diapolycopene oxygenase
MGAFKPANRSSDVDGLYLAGGAAHPGPGMPMVMMSGWIAADSLDADAKNTDSRLMRSKVAGRAA